MVVASAAVLLVVGCSSDTGARAGVDRVLEMGHPLVQSAYVRGDFLDGDAAYVYVADDATDADARTVWCAVMVPSGLVEGRLRAYLATTDQKHRWYMPDCDDPGDVPKRERY